MPTNKRKGRRGRGKQRKDEDDAINRNRKACEDEGSASWNLMRHFKADGCRVEFGDDGSVVVLHPCMKPDDESGEKLSNRALWDDKEKSIVVGHYVHNFEQGLRDGDLEGTTVIARNLSCPHLKSKLSEALFEADIHYAILDFLGHCHGRLSAALQGAVGERETIPRLWLDMLGMMVHGCSEQPHDARLAEVAKRLEPVVICMIHERRQLFRSNNNWHTSLSSFFSLVFDVMCQSREGRRIMISYEGFLSFVAQASCWGVSREDIVKEARWLQLGDSFSIACYEAQRLMCLVVDEHDIEEDHATSSNFLLEQIACTPLSNDHECKDSTMAGFVRIMRSDQEDNPSFLPIIFKGLLLAENFVDTRVIAELIDYGRNDLSIETAEYVMGLILGILGVDDDYKHIRRSDSRYAAAIRYGLLEWCISWPIAPLKTLFEGLSSVAIHSKTSRVLSGKREQIFLALDMLRKREGIVLPILDSINDVDTSTCCNCLKKFETKKLRFCNCCKVEQYCTLSCQAKSWNAGHGRFCKTMARDSDYLTTQGISETDIKRWTTLKSDLMVTGCSFVQSNMYEILKLSVEQHGVLIDFGLAPPVIKLLTRNDTDECSGSEGLYCEFVLPVMYGFAARLGCNSIIYLPKYIPRLEDRTCSNQEI